MATPSAFRGKIQATKTFARRGRSIHQHHYLGAMLMSNLILLSKFRETEIELWKPTAIPDYEVSNLGRIRSLKMTKRLAPQRDRRRMPLIRMLDGNISRSRSGYPTVCLTVALGKEKNETVHRLVAEAFLPNPSGLPEINHKNGVKTDARMDNLEWCTPQQNHAHATAYGLKARGEKHHRAELTEDDVRTIRALRKRGLTYRQIAGHIGKVGWAMVAKIIEGKNWTHVT